MPSRSRRAVRSASDVTGVMRSTMEFGNLHADSTHDVNSEPTAAAAASTVRRAVSPLPGRLSQLRIVTGAPLSRRRWSRARAMRSNVEPAGMSSVYPASVTVIETIAVVGSASTSIVS